MTWPDSWSDARIKAAARQTPFSFSELRVIRDRREYSELKFSPMQVATHAALNNWTLEHAAQNLESLRRT